MRAMLAGVPSHHSGGRSGGRQPVPARPWVVQRLARGVAPTVEESAVPEPRAAAEGESALLAEDDVADLASGQMRKRAFLAELRAGVCATAEESLAAVGRTADGCPYIEQWFAHYEGRDAAHVEQALRRYAPGAGGVTAASDYIPVVCDRVRQGIATWARTGELSGVPEELPAEPLGGTTGKAATTGGPALFAKPRAGEAARPDPARPQAVLDRLGSGQPLEPQVRAPFEGVFGHSFADVRVHTDGAAAGLADGFAARAFTVGTHVAFADGEYRPGTLVGDAVLAHELAHVVQQGGAPGLASAGPARDAVEEDADLSAVSAVAAVWSPGRLARLVRTAVPRARSGLRLQRCAAGAQQVRRGGELGGCTKEQRESVEVLPPPSCCTPRMTGEIDAARSEAVGRVRRALGRLSAPESARALLHDHFSVSPEDTARVRYVREHFDRMLATMTTAGGVRFFCRDAADHACRAFGRRAAADNCSSVRPPNLWLCGNYNGERFLADEDWVRSLTHEYAHAACTAVGGILAAGAESYRHNPPYPPADPDRAIRNADSYAWFAAES